jgi:hypothetical protein
MKLTGSELQQLQQVMMSAFPTRAALEQFALFQLGENLNVIAGGDTLGDLVFSLMRWAVATGRIEEVIGEAQAANPGNPDLQAFAQQILRTNRRTRRDDSIAGKLAAGDHVPLPGSSPPDPEAVDNQQKLLATHRQTLAFLLQQRAAHSSASSPVSILNGIVEARQGIERCKAVLRSWGLAAGDDPSDSE